MSDDKSCGWQGYGFGAGYEDAACCDGEIWDLDSCDEPGGPLMNTHGEKCPQCEGTGAPVDGERGPMALIRKRDKEDLEELINDVSDTELKLMIILEVGKLFNLVRKLEEPEQLTLDT